MGYKHS